MPLTAAQIVERAAQELQVARIGQGLQSQDNARITQAYAEVYAQLKNEGLAAWASSASVPDAPAPYVIALVAKNCLGTYGVSPARYNRIIAMTGEDGQAARTMISRYVSAPLESVDDVEDF